MHKKDLGIPRRKNGIPVKKKKAKTELSKHQKTREKKTLALEKQQDYTNKTMKGKRHGRKLN